MSAFSNKKSTSQATFKRHQVHEVASSLTDSKHIANDIANNMRYAYRASATLVGEASIRPYDPIYLDGLPNGLSGYWTVLSAKHIFGGMPLNYSLHVELGTDVLGDVDVNAINNVHYRDVQAELAGQNSVVQVPDFLLVSYSPNGTELMPSDGTTIPTSAVTPAYNTPTADISANPYDVSSPTPPKTADTVTWVINPNGGTSIA